MDKPAVIEGCYVDLKFMPGIKCARVSIDIPIEHSNAFLKMFDAPDRANPVPVVVARLATSPAEQPSGAQAPATPKPDRTYSRSQIAAMRLKDPKFSGWLYKRYFVAGPLEPVDKMLKRVLGIESKTELDAEGPKAQAFDALLTEFDTRNYRR